jgi:hypothetical protein
MGGPTSNYATASIALRIRPHKPDNSFKVRIPSGVGWGEAVKNSNSCRKSNPGRKFCGKSSERTVLICMLYGNIRFRNVYQPVCHFNLWRVQHDSDLTTQILKSDREWRKYLNSFFSTCCY